MEQDMTKASGFIYYYGISPALNLLEDSVACKNDHWAD